MSPKNDDSGASVREGACVHSRLELVDAKLLGEGGFTRSDNEEVPRALVILHVCSKNYGLDYSLGAKKLIGLKHEA